MTKKKRADGEGSICKRPNGTWEAHLSIPGQYKTKSFYGKTKERPAASARRPRRLSKPATPSTHRSRLSASTLKDGSKALSRPPSRRPTRTTLGSAAGT